jgi:hypothetical protein
MKQRTYQDFDVLFERVPAPGHEVYHARLIKSPAGETKIEFGRYYSPQQWDYLKASSASWTAFSQADTAHIPISPATSLQSQLPRKQLGEHLFTHVFHGSLRQCLLNSLHHVKHNNMGLRILLRLNEVPELAILPWEYLYAPSPYGFLTLSADTPIVRYLDIPYRTDTVVTKTEKLRILVVISQPEDLPSLNVSEEWEKLQEALTELQSQNQVELEQLSSGTIDELHNRLKLGNEPIHILHFMGHGIYESKNNEGIIYFETANKKSDPVKADRLVTVLKDHHSLQLIFLNSCEGGQSGKDDIFSGSAQNLFRNLHSNLIAVIAMQSQLGDQTAIILAHDFYKSLAAGHTITESLAEARQSLARENNDEWGTPVLFMRVHDGNFFDTPISTQYSGFQKLNLENNLYQIEPKTSKKFSQVLCDTHLLILSDEPHLTLQELAHQIAYELHKKFLNLLILEWQEDPAQLNFRELFPLHEKFIQACDHAIFIIPEVAHDLFTDFFFAELLPQLHKREQYLILITSALKNSLTLHHNVIRSWPQSEKLIYKNKFLTKELEQKLQKNESRLPKQLLSRLKGNNSDLGHSLSKIASQLRLPTNMDTFVERLCNQEAVPTKEYIQELIYISKTERDKDKLKYLYNHLPSRSDQLLVAGVCLLGGTTETQFFQLLERILKNSWQYAFTEVEILDYYHLHNLQHFFKYEERESGQFPTERTILPQYPNQWWYLLLIIWESHRNHLRRTFQELATIIIDSVTNDRRDDYGSMQQRQRLRDSIGVLFSNVGRIALPSIEDTLLDLASYRYPSAQAVVAEVLVRWYDKNEKFDARDQLFNLLQRWLSLDWNKESNWKSNQRDQRHIRITVARTLNQLLDKITDPIPDPLPDLLLEVIDNNDKVLKLFDTNISRKIFPNRSPHLIQRWQAAWESSAKADTVAKRIQTIHVIAPFCKRYNQLHLIASWLVDVLGYGIKEYANKIIFLLQQRRFLIKAIFPAHLSKLNDNGVLLYLTLCGNFETDILDVFLEVHQNNPQSVQAILEQWRVKWSSYTEQIKELDDQNWYNVLSLVGKFYDDVEQFNSFQAWLPCFIEDDDINTQSQIVDLLYRINIHQSINWESIQPNSVTLGIVQTGVVRIVYSWLCNEQKGSSFHLIAFWLSAKMLSKIDRRSMRRNMRASFYLKRFIPFLVAPLNRSYRVVIGNLLPTMDDLSQDKPEEIFKVVSHWKKSSTGHTL